MSSLNPEINEYVESRIAEFSHIAELRNQNLLNFSKYIETQLARGKNHERNH